MFRKICYVLVANGVLHSTIVSTTGGLDGRHGTISSLGIFPIPSNSANAGVSVAVNGTIHRLRGLDNRATNGITDIGTSTLLHNTENGSNIVASLLFHNFTGNVNGTRAISTRGFGSTFTVNIRTTCGTMVGPARNAVLAITEITDRCTRGTCETNGSRLNIFRSTLDNTGITLTRAPRVLPRLGGTNIISTNNRNFILVLRNVLSMFGSNIVVGSGSSTTIASSRSRRSSSHGTTNRFRARVAFACYARFVMGETRSYDGRPDRLHTFLRAVNSYIIIISSRRVVGIRIRASRPNGTVRGTLAFNSLIRLGVRGVHSRRRGTGRSTRVTGGGPIGGTRHARAFAPIRPAGPINFISIYTNSNLSSLFGSLNISAVISNNRAVGPDASSVLGTVRSAPTRAIFILPGGGGVVVTTRRTVPVDAEGIVIVRAEAVPRNVNTVLTFSPSISSGGGTVTVRGTVRHVAANRMAFTTESTSFSNFGVGRNRLVTLLNNGMAFISASLRGAILGLLGGVVGPSDRFVAIVCNDSMAPDRTTRVRTGVRAGFNSGTRVAVVGNNRPVCCCVLSMRWKRFVVATSASVRCLGNINTGETRVLGSGNVSAINTLLHFFPQGCLSFAGVVAMGGTPFNIGIYIGTGVMDPVRRGGVGGRVIVCGFITRSRDKGFVMDLFGRGFLTRGLGFNSICVFCNGLSNDFVVHRVGSPVVGPRNCGIVRPICPTDHSVASGAISDLVGATLGSIPIARALPRVVVREGGLYSLRFTVRGVRFPLSRRAFRGTGRQLIFRRLFVLRTTLSVVGFGSRRGDNYIVGGGSFSIFRGDLRFGLAGTRVEIVGRYFRSVGSNQPVDQLVRKSIKDNGAIITTTLYTITTRGNCRSTLVTPARVLTRRRFGALARVGERDNVGYKLLANSVATGRGDAIGATLTGNRVSVVINARTLLASSITFGGLKLMVASRRRHFNIGRHRGLAGGNRGPRALIVSTAPVPRALKLVLFNSLSVDIVSRCPGNERGVSACLISSDCHAHVCGCVGGFLRGNRRKCVIYPLMRSNSRLSLGSTGRCCGSLYRGRFGSCGLKLLRNGVSSGRGRGAVHRFTGKRVRLLITAAIVRINVSIPGTMVVIVRSTSHFNLSRLRRLEKHVNEKRLGSSYILVDSDGSPRALRELRIVGGDASKFGVTSGSFRLHNPNSFLNDHRRNVPRVGVTSLFFSGGMLLGTGGRTRLLLQFSPGLGFPRGGKLQRRVVRLCGGLG